MKASEIAAALGVAEGTVHSHLHAARGKLVAGLERVAAGEQAHPLGSILDEGEVVRRCLQDRGGGPAQAVEDRVVPAVDQRPGPALRLGDLVRRVGRVDVFVHDSFHPERNLLFEWETVLPWLGPSGFLVADDVQGEDRADARHRVARPEDDGIAVAQRR